VRSEPLVPGEVLPWVISSPGDERMTFSTDKARARASAESVPPIAVPAMCSVTLARAAIHGRNVPPGRADLTMKRPRSANLPRLERSLPCPARRALS
jgi:hypothetical protein